MKRVRFAPSPTGSLHVGNALSAVANRAFGDWLLLRIDDTDFGITHILRGNDHRPNEALHRRLFEALGARPPEILHHGLILGEDGKKLAKRAPGATVASLREAGIPAEAVRRYLEELGVPRHDVRYDLPRIRRLAVEAIAALPDDDLAARVDAPVELEP